MEIGMADAGEKNLELSRMCAAGASLIFAMNVLPAPGIITFFIS
jgi:hypothetical protein